MCNQINCLMIAPEPTLHYVANIKQEHVKRIPKLVDIDFLEPLVYLCQNKTKPFLNIGLLQSMAKE